jgi:uncharacterized membrane protein
MTVTDVVRLVGVFATGLLAGGFVYTVATVQRTFYAVPMGVHLTFRIALMSRNAVYMQAMMALSVISSIWLSVAPGVDALSRGCAIAAAVFALTCFLVTRFGNVPLNGLIRSWSAETPESVWRKPLRRWDTFHLIRTAAAAAAFAAMVITSR